MTLDFPDNEEATNKQRSLIYLKKSKLKDDECLNELYKSIIDNFDYPENYLILVFHDVYDIITKTKDNQKLDESEEVFEYVLCAICPVSLSAPGLSYFEEENKIKSRLRDWIVDAPINGFVYPAFIDRSADVNSIMYYTKNPKDIHPELMEKTLGCPARETSTIQKEKFKLIIEDSMGADEEEAKKLYMEIQENLNYIVEEQKAESDGFDVEPNKLSKNVLHDILWESGIPTDNLLMIEDLYEQSFDEEIPVVENLLDSRVIKEIEQRKKELALEKQVEFLTVKLEEAELKDSLNEEYDIVLQVKPEKVEEIKKEVIDGQEYILIPVKENEKTTIN